MKIASVVWQYTSTQDTPYQVDGFLSVDGDVKVDISKELKTPEAAAKNLREIVEKIQTEIRKA